MRTDGERHPLDFFKENLYDPVTVTQDNYTQYAALGIYKNKNKIYISNGIKKIKFRYYSPNNILLEADTVPIIYDGVKGDQGVPGIDGIDGNRGPSYRGLGENDGYIEDPVKDDYYLNVKDGCIHKYQDDKWKIIKNVSEAYAEYNRAVQDGIKYFTTLPDTAPIITAFSVWCNNIFSASGVINTLFSNNITIQEGGFIQSARYGMKEDGNYVPGFKLNSNGVFDCFNGTFRGSIDSGPLYLDNTAPAGFVFHFYTGYSYWDTTQSFLQSGFESNKDYSCSGSFEGYSMSTIRMSNTRLDDDYIIKSETVEEVKEGLFNKVTYVTFEVSQGGNWKQEVTINGSTTFTGRTRSHHKMYKCKYAWYEGLLHGTNQELTPEFIESIRSTKGQPINLTEGYLTQPGSASFNNGGRTIILRDLPSTYNPGLAKGALYVENGYVRIKT